MNSRRSQKLDLPHDRGRACARTPASGPAVLQYLIIPLIAGSGSPRSFCISLSIGIFPFFFECSGCSLVRMFMASLFGRNQFPEYSRLFSCIQSWP